MVRLQLALFLLLFAVPLSAQHVRVNGTTTQYSCQSIIPIVDASIQNQWNVTSCQISANTLVTNGDTLQILAGFRVPANTNAREYALFLAPTTATCSGTGAALCDAGCQLPFAAITHSTSNGSVDMDYTVTRTGAATQTARGRSISVAATQGQVTSACTLTSTAALKVAIGARNTAAAATSVVNSILHVLYFPR